MECYVGKSMLHACFSILLFMYKGKILRWIFKVVFLEMRILRIRQYVMWPTNYSFFNLIPQNWWSVSFLFRYVYFVLRHTLFQRLQRSKKIIKLRVNTALTYILLPSDGTPGQTLVSAHVIGLFSKPSWRSFDTMTSRTGVLFMIKMLFTCVAYKRLHWTSNHSVGRSDRLWQQYHSRRFLMTQHVRHILLIVWINYYLTILCI